MLPLSCCYDICHIASGFLPGLTEGISEFIDGANVGSKLVPHFIQLLHLIVYVHRFPLVSCTDCKLNTL